MSTMRIAMIGPFGLRPKGTMSARALPLARELAKRGHAVKVLMPPWHTPNEEARRWQEDGVHLEYVALGPNVPGLSHLAVTCRLLWKALDWRPDVVHCFKPKAYAGLVAWALWQMRRLGLTRARLVVDEDDWEGPGGWNELEPYTAIMRGFFRWQERWGLCHNDAVTVASRALQSLTWSLGVPPDRVHYVPNGGARIGLGNQTSIEAQHALGDGPMLLLYTRFFEYNVARILEVLNQVVQAIPGTRLLVVGQGLYARDDRRFDQLVAERGLGEQVQRVGWGKDVEERLVDYFSLADVALYPMDDTLINRTKCAVKLVDLLWAGVPVVADAVGQNREYIVHGETGVLVDAGDATAMARAVIRLLRDNQRRRAMGAASAAHMRAHFGWGVLVENLISGYEATHMLRA